MQRNRPEVCRLRTMSIIRRAAFGMMLLCLAGAAFAQTAIISDYDGDGILDPADNCPGRPNPAQVDIDADGFGDACDSCPSTMGPECLPDDPTVNPLTHIGLISMAAKADTDGDGYSNLADVCVGTPDPDQKDADGDGVGDACDACPAEAARGMTDGCPEGG